MNTRADVSAGTFVLGENLVDNDVDGRTRHSDWEREF